MTLTVELRKVRSGLWRAAIPQMPNIEPVEAADREVAYHKIAARAHGVIADQIERGRRKVAKVALRRSVKRMAARSAERAPGYGASAIAEMAAGSGFTVQEYRELLDDNPLTRTEARATVRWANRVRSGKEKALRIRV